MTADNTNGRDDAVWENVRTRYGELAQEAREGRSAAGSVCCGTSGCCGPSTPEALFGATLYPLDDLSELPQEAVLASLGCGNPTAVAELRPGEVVLDLGSGGGIDVILSARRVGPAGRAYGLDMTDDMLELARENARRAGAANVEFLRGRIEDVPLPGGSVDVVISNCVVNLSPDKDRVLREAFRVLRPGGRLAISDVVVRDPEPGEPPIPAEVLRSMELWAGCIAGAMGAGDYRDKLGAAGFVDAEVLETRRYTAGELGEPYRRALAERGIAGDAAAEAIAGRFASAVVRAVKPETNERDAPWTGR